MPSAAFGVSGNRHQGRAVVEEAHGGVGKVRLFGPGALQPLVTAASVRSDRPWRQAAPIPENSGEVWPLPQRSPQKMMESPLQAQDGLEPTVKRGSTMYSINRKLLLRFAAAGAFIAFTAVSPPARADDFAENLGPVGPHDPILTTFGNKRIIAFFERENGRCAVSAVVWEKSDAETGMTTSARVRVSLNPRQVVHIDSTDNKSINLQCSDRGQTLGLVDTNKIIAAGAAK
jgi:hypothetical protein